MVVLISYWNLFFFVHLYDYITNWSQYFVIRFQFFIFNYNWFLLKFYIFYSVTRLLKWSYKDINIPNMAGVELESGANCLGMRIPQSTDVCVLAGSLFKEMSQLSFYKQIIFQIHLFIFVWICVCRHMQIRIQKNTNTGCLGNQLQEVFNYPPYAFCIFQIIQNEP